MVDIILNKEKNTLKVNNITLRGIVGWKNRILYHECIQKVKELRKEDKSTNFVSSSFIDKLLVDEWKGFSDEIKDFFLAFTPSACREWIVYGPCNGAIKENTIKFSDGIWTSIVDEIPKEIIEEYNTIINDGLNAALFIKEYNNGENLPVVEDKNKRIIITPAKKDIIVIRNFLRKNGTAGEVDGETGLVLEAEDAHILLNNTERKRWIYSVSKSDFYAGPVARGDNSHDIIYFVRPAVVVDLKPSYKLRVLVTGPGILPFP